MNVVMYVKEIHVLSAACILFFFIGAFYYQSFPYQLESFVCE